MGGSLRKFKQYTIDDDDQSQNFKTLKSRQKQKQRLQASYLVLAICYYLDFNGQGSWRIKIATGLSQITSLTAFNGFH
jgi:hypothetical protein